MDVKDSAMRFYIQNFIISKYQNIETPGFVFFKLSGKSPIYARQVVMPESFFVNLEINIAKKGRIHQQSLYSAGKKFGYRFSLLGGFSNILDKKGHELINYLSMINKFIEGTYATKIEFKADIYTKSCNYLMENPIVVNKLGYGYFLPLGAAAGLLSYIFQDSSIEGILEHFDLKTDKGSLLYAPKGYLEKNNKQFFSEENLSGLEPTTDYINFNQVVPLKYSDYSFKMLLDSKLFSFNNGVITNNKERYFILEVSALYIIEKELFNYYEEIYDAAFKSGYAMLENIGKISIKTIIDYLSAFGWGNVLITEKDTRYIVNVNNFPYTKFYNKVNYSIFSGILSGMLYAVTKKKTIFNKFESNLLEGHLSISLFS